MLEREGEEASTPTMGYTLSQMLGAPSASVWDVAILGPPTLRFAISLRANPSAAAAKSISLSNSTYCTVVNFFAAPLVGVDSDVFGLQGFTSALEISGLTCPSMLLLMLPCIVASLETCAEKDLTSMLLRDVSVSPFQRYYHSLSLIDKALKSALLSTPLQLIYYNRIHFCFRERY